MEENAIEIRIKKENDRLMELFKNAGNDILQVATPLIQNSAFMKATLEDLQEEIKLEGVVDIYQNGSNQFGKKQSATLQSYNALIKNYNTVTKTIIGMLPDDKSKKVNKNPLTELLSKYDDDE